MTRRRRIWTEKEKIEIFLERVDDLKKTKLVSSGFYVSTKISWSEDEGLKVVLSPVEDDDLRSFITVFRHFVSSDEPTHLYGLFSLCQKILNDESLKRDLIEIRKHWKSSLEKNGLKFELNGKELKPERIMDIWVNSWSHHNDPDYRKLLKSFSSEGLAIFKAFFLDALCESSKVIISTGEVVRLAYDNSKFVFESS